jgi:hypothetical protein
MYYGYSSAPDVQDIPGTYDTNFTAVWHLNESSGTLYDSTSNDLDGSQSGGVTYGTTGQVDGAVFFDGNDDRVSVSDDDLLDPPNDMTIEAWVKFDVLSSTLGRTQTYVAKRHTEAPWQSYELLMNSGDSLRFGWANSVDNTYVGWNGDPRLDTWYYTVGVKDGDTLRYYINGGTADCFTDTVSDTMLNADLALRIGDDENEVINGTVDEVRLSDTARSADWIAAQYLNMIDGFLTFESEDDGSSAGAAYIFFGYPGIDLSNINAANANVTIYGENAGDHFGWSVSDLGNVDSDTKDDIIIGAPDYDSSTAYIAWDSSDTRVEQYASSTQGHPAVVVDSEGNSIYVWHDSRGAAYDIYAQKLDKYGDPLWGSSDVMVNQVADGAEYDWGLDIVLDSNDNAIVVWTDNRNGDGNFSIYAQKIDPYGEAQWGSSDVRVNQDTTASANRSYPAIDIDSSDNVIVVWQDERAGDGNWSIYAQKLDSSGTPLWGSSDKLVNQDDYYAYAPQPDVTVDSNGNAIAVWTDYESAEFEDINAQKLDPAGIAQWGSYDIQVNQDDDDDKYRAAIDVDPNDNVIVVWQDERADGTNDDIYAQKLNSMGLALWGPSDRLVNQDSTTALHDYAHVAVDSSGYAFVAWKDARHGGANDSIYAQRLDPSGTTLWGSSDLRVNKYTDSYDREYPFAAIDNDGCAIVAWDDERTGSNDIYAQKLFCEDAGRAYIFYGQASWSSSYSASAADVKIDGEYNGDMFGNSVSRAGDVDGSDYNDTIVGAYGYNYDQGRAYIFYGDGSIPTSAGSADKTYTGENIGDKFGFSVSTAGDVDNDGKEDFIIGAPYNDDSGTDAGEAYVYFSSDQYAYVDSNTVTYGYVSSFNNAKSASDSGAYATLTEESVAGDETSYTEHVIGSGATCDGAEDIEIIDFDDDGDMDAVTASYEEDKIAWWDNQGDDETFTERQIKLDADTDGAVDVEVVDIDSDGDYDVFYAAQLEDRIGWLENDGTNLSFTDHEIIESSAYAQDVKDIEVIDFDEDGYYDVVHAALTDDEISWFENDGTNDGWTRRNIADGADWDGPYDVEVVDFDDDNDYDVVYAAMLEDRVGWFENDGTDLSFTDHEIIESSTQAQDVVDVEPIDFDEDGDMDVVIAASTDDLFSWWRNGGDDTIFDEAWSVTGEDYDGAWEVSVVDFDDDSDYDIVYAAMSEDRVGWFENDGTDTSFTDNAINESATQSEDVVIVEAVDFDLDGDYDVATAVSTDDRFTWWEVSRPSNYKMDIEFNTDGVPVGSSYTLELNYSVDGTETAFGVLVYDGSSWDDLSAQGDLSSTSFTTKSYTLESDHRLSSGNVRVRFIGRNETSDSANSTLNIEYHRIKVTSAYLTLSGEYAGHMFGWSVANASDVNNDGSYDDVIVGAPYYRSEPYSADWGSSDIMANQNSDSAQQKYSDIAVDSNGNVFVVWTDERNGASDDDIYIQKFGPSGNPQWGSTDVKVNGDSGTAVQEYPSVAVDSNDNVIVVWQDERDGASNNSIYAQKFDTNGNKLWDSSDVRVNQYTTSSNQYAPQIAIDSDGNSIVVWYESRGSNDIYAQKLDPNGIAQWGSSDVRINQYTTLAQQRPAVALDSQGYAIIAWEDTRHGAVGNYSIYAQKVDTDGDAVWGSSDVRVNQYVSPSNKMFPRIAVDSDGNSVIVWEDDREGISSERIYAQRLDRYGVAQWSSPDALVNQDTTFDATDADVAVDSNNQFYVVWADESGSDDNIYVQKLDLDGNTHWGSSDLRVNQETGDAMGDPEVAVDNNGNIIVSFTNEVDYDIYMQKFKATEITGRAYIFNGASSMDATADVSLTGEADGDRFGFSVHGAGDVSGDGIPDVIVGAPYYDDGTTSDVGNVYIFYGGSSMDSTADYIHKGTQANMHFGWSVSLAVSMDGSSYAQVVVGGPHYDDGSEEDAGTAEVLYMFVIPEYSTIAIPVFVILLFIALRRRKEKIRHKCHEIV